MTARAKEDFSHKNFSASAVDPKSRRAWCPVGTSRLRDPMKTGQKQLFSTHTWEPDHFGLREENTRAYVRKERSKIQHGKFPAGGPLDCMSPVFTRPTRYDTARPSAGNAAAVVSPRARLPNLTSRPATERMSVISGRPLLRRKVS